MTVIQAIVLGIVQGITEFLPISSSGHLILVPYFLGWEIQDLSFDIGLHAGTALAVLVYFRTEWANMIKYFFKDLPQIIKLPKTRDINVLRRESKMLLFILIATIPVALVGFFLEDYIETFFRSPLLVAFMFIVISFVMWAADSHASKNPSTNDGSKLKDILKVSLSQIIALIPGTSRSGITMSTGLFLGMTREGAAKISFLLATPIVVGAALFAVPDAIGSNTVDPILMLIGFLTSFIVGFACIKWFLSFLKTRTLMPFIIYRFILAAIIIISVLVAK